MASYHLGVDVISIDVPSSSNNSLTNYFVELHFNGESRTTSVKENVPVWNEMLSFHMRERADPSGDLTLEAAVYSIDLTRNSRSLLGKVLLSDDDFDRHSANVVSIRHPLMSTDPDLPHVNGTLLLKVFLITAGDILLETDESNHQTEDGRVHNFINYLFDSEDCIASQSADTVPKEISPNFEPGRVVERMLHLFVRVVKARRLPDVDANGSLDPYVEVKFGAYNWGVTKCLKRNKNPEWNETFAFSFQHGKTPSPGVDVVVYDKDPVRDDLVGKLYFDLKDIPTRSPDDIPLEPTWYPLLDQDGKRLAQANLLLAIWIGSQADEVYRHVWVSEFSPKVYEIPRLWCLLVTIVEAQGVTLADDDAGITEMFCKACLGNQIQKTRTVKMQTTSSGSYAWKEDLMFVAAEPFFEGDLEVSVIANLGIDEEVIGQLTIPLLSIEKRANDDHLVTPQWFDLRNPAVPQLDGFVDEGNDNRHMRICLRNLLDGGYHIAHDLQGYMDDTRPADRQLWNPPIGSVYLGILRAIGLQHRNQRDGKSASKPYCVAKYGDRWVRTRTVIDGSDHVFNEQYTWDIYDITTVLTVGVFHHCLQKADGSTNAHHNIGKVQIQLSYLEMDRIYAHSYPLFIMSPSGVMKTGELQLAVKISSASSMNMLSTYAQPTLPKMHYVHPLTAMEEGELRSQAVSVLALRLNRMEPPLRSEVVACMCNDTERYNSWSLRKMKANFFRVGAVVSPLKAWFEGVQRVLSWRNPAVTLLAHASLVLGLWFHKLLLPVVLVYGALVAAQNYRCRPRSPPHAEYDPSLLGSDELDEEFDTVKTSRSDKLVRMRYDRLRSIAGRVQIIVGDCASEGERIESLISWRDPRATAFFQLFILMTAVVVYFVPFKVLVGAAGFYVMRHPRFRRKTPSVLMNFFRRLPCKRDEIF